LLPPLTDIVVAAAAATVTAAVCEMGTFPAPASAAAEMVLASAVVDVKVAVNVPPALVVPDAGLSVLLVPVDDSVTVALPIGLLNPSRTVTVIVEAVDPATHPLEQAVIVPVAAATEDWVGLTLVCATPVAVKVTGVSPVADALSVLVPAPVPSVQLVTRARPLAFVATGAMGATEPPPPVTVNVTGTPGIELLYWSRTKTTGGTATGVFTVAAWPSPLSAVIVLGAPRTTASVTLIILGLFVALDAVSETVAE